ncbi:MAG: GDP-mannose 4,6-dehydratase [Candidatus Omnitrophica bacterium]|nr:GDP-mannose 4,6-dehydratase [Candidatus Omnitrophota bacterium]
MTALLRSDGYHLLGVQRSGPADITRYQEVENLLRDFHPDEIYYLAGYHHSSEGLPNGDILQLYQRSHEIHVSSLIHFLEGMRLRCPAARLFYAASSLIFANGPGGIQNEQTPLNPKGVYGITKAAGLLMCREYRTAHHLFVSTGILYNHESPLRRDDFISKKIVLAAIAAEKGRTTPLEIGNLEAETDWGYAPDYVDAMHRILLLPAADEFIIATGEKHSVLDFVKAAFAAVGIDWKGRVVEKPGLLQRKSPVLIGDSGKLRRATGWKPSVTFEEMVRALIEGTKALQHGQ